MSGIRQLSIQVTNFDNRKTNIVQSTIFNKDPWLKPNNQLLRV